MAGPAIKNAVVLYGALRSGTTLFRLLLDGHPNINCPGERDFLLDHLTREDDALKLNRSALSIDRIFQESGLSLPESDDGNSAVRGMIDEEGRTGETLVLIIHRDLQNLLEIMPDIPVIHLVRDPRDVARSSIGMGWVGNTWYGVNHWIKTEKQWDKIADQVSPDQVYDLRYEDLLLEPERRLGEVCHFLGHDYDAEMMRYPERSTYASINPNLSYQWKKKLSEKDLAMLEFKLGPLLQAKGYEPSGIPPQPPSSLRRFQLWIQTKRAFWSASFKRYGFIDLIVLRLARRLGMTGLARSTKARISAKTARNLKSRKS
ncbi:MAG: sulfotransferase [Pseudomonadota bacterium]